MEHGFLGVNASHFGPDWINRRFHPRRLRFVLTAEIIGMLEHPGIVPVEYNVAVDVGVRHSIVMVLRWVVA